MNDEIETIEYRGQLIKIYQDEDARDPRDWDNLGTMICFHNQYELGDEHELRTEDFDNWDGVKQYLMKEKNAFIILSLFLYDHSGLRMKIGSFSGLLAQGHAEFDSGQVGFIYVTPEDVRKCYMVKRITEKIRNQVRNNLISEVNTYDDYLSGNVYGFMSETSDGEDIDSCWGFFGDTDYMISGAKSGIDCYVLEGRKQHYKTLKGYIKGKVPLMYRKPLDTCLTGA